MNRSHSEIPVAQRRTGISFLLLVLIVLAAGCSSTEFQPGEPPHYAGSFEASCSPVDAPALLFELYRLGDPEPPQVSISVWRFEFPLAGSRIDLGEYDGHGAAFIGGTEWIPAIDGELGLESYREGEVASGWFWLELDGIDRVEGQFEATWTEGLAICG